MKNFTLLAVFLLLSCAMQPVIADDGDFVDPSLQKTVTLSADRSEYCPGREHLWVQLHSRIKKGFLDEIRNEEVGFLPPQAVVRLNNPDIAWVKVDHRPDSSCIDGLSLIHLKATIQFRHNRCVQKRYIWDTYDKTYDTSDHIFDCDDNIHRLFAEIKQREQVSS
jgi:hypothetical protein